MIFSGTAATYGRGGAVVTATGMQTQMGLIAGMLKEAPTETTPLQKDSTVYRASCWDLVVVIAVVMITHDASWSKTFAVSRALVDVLILGVALAVAAVPEGLPRS